MSKYKKLKEPVSLNRRISTKITSVEVKRVHADKMKAGIDMKPDDISVIILTCPFSLNNLYSAVDAFSFEMRQRQVITQVCVGEGSVVASTNTLADLFQQELANNSIFNQRNNVATNRCDLIMEVSPRLIVYFIVFQGNDLPSIFEIDYAGLFNTILCDLERTFDDLSIFKLYIKYFDDIEKSMIYRELKSRIPDDKISDVSFISEHFDDVKKSTAKFLERSNSIMDRLEKSKFKKVYILKKVK